MIVGISGRMGSGKDLTGKIIQYLTLPTKHGPYIGFETFDDATLERNSKFEVKKFAGKLKQIASLLTGVDIKDFEDQKFKQQQMPEDWDMTYRTFLQKLGTEAMRDGLHTNVWVNALFADYHPTPNKSVEESFKEQFLTGRSEIHYKLPNWIITDMRFPNELDAVKSKGGITIKVNRLYSTTGGNGIPATFSQTQFHPSETALDTAKFDYEIINDAGIPELIEKVRQILITEKII